MSEGGTRPYTSAAAHDAREAVYQRRIAADPVARLWGRYGELPLAVWSRTSTRCGSRCGNDSAKSTNHKIASPDTTAVRTGHRTGGGTNESSDTCHQSRRAGVLRIDTPRGTRRDTVLTRRRVDIFLCRKFVSDAVTRCGGDGRRIIMIITS